MQTSKIACGEARITLIVAWALLGGYELRAWLAHDQFPPTTVMIFAHVGLATLTVVCVILRAASAIEQAVQSARVNFDLGREVGAVHGPSRGPNLRAVDDAR